MNEQLANLVASAADALGRADAHLVTGDQVRKAVTLVEGRLDGHLTPVAASAADATLDVLEQRADDVAKVGRATLSRLVDAIAHGEDAARVAWLEHGASFEERDAVAVADHQAVTAETAARAADKALAFEVAREVFQAGLRVAPLVLAAL